MHGTPTRANPILAMLWLLASLASGPCAAAGAPAADVVYVHGRIYTVDPTRPWAQALAVRGERLLAVGEEQDVRAFQGRRTKVVDLGGRLVTPGFIDAHVHFTDGGWYLKNVALRDARTMAEVAHRVAAYLAAHPQADWVLGEGWSYTYPDLPQGEFHRQIIDAVAAGHPVLLNSGMAHAAWVNSEALRRAGISAATPDPAGGQIVRDAHGEPTGWLKEDAAINLVLARVPAPPRAATRQALLAAIGEAGRVGITRVDSAGGDFANLGLLAELERERRLTVRVSIAQMIEAPGLDAATLAAMEAARRRYHGALLSCCVAKFIMDGVIESHTAYLPGGYADDPAQTGMRFFERAPYLDSVARLNARGFQVYTHAIGNGAIALALDAYEASQAALGAGAASPRNRVEHAEAPDRADIARFARLGVIASLQPLMIYPRDEWQGMEGLWERYAGEGWLTQAFAIRSLLDAGATVAFGTDWPIVQLDPLLGIRNAVLRQSLDGQPAGGYRPEQRVSVAEAVRAYTRDAAYASRRDEEEGSLERGKLADFVVFSDDFIEGPAARINAAHVLLTVVGGRVVYRAQGAP